MPRQENLTVIKAGLSRQRVKGAALKDTLYDLLNGYVTTEKTVKVRPGTLLSQTLTTGTVGLVHHDAKFHVFADATVAGLPADYELHILKSPDDSSFDLTRIHFAEPFLGALYVVAEFAGGGIYHYWLQDASDWEATTDYEIGDVVSPTTPNGFVYKARRLAQANPAWSAGTPRAVTDVVEPTVENGFKYTVTQVVGPTPRSGSVEPEWPTEVGAVIIEDLDTEDIPTADEAPTPDRTRDDFIDETRRDRYLDSGGRRPRR
jgi:hypothetical protein